MPAQTLLAAAAFVDEIIAVDHEQLQIPGALLTRSRPIEVRLAQRDPRDRQGVDRVRLATRPAAAPSGTGQPRRHPHQLLTRSDQVPLERPGHLPAILDRPQPCLAKMCSPQRQGRIPDTRAAARQAAAPPRQLRPPSTSACVHPLRSRSFDSPPTHAKGATGERTGLTRGSCQAPIRSRSTVSGRRRRHNAGRSAPTDRPEWSQPPPTRVSCAHRTPPSADDDSECGNVP
jgi:hypothetical protein